MPDTFNAEGKNFLEIAIDKAHAATAHCGIKNTMKATSDKFEYQSFSCLVRKYVGSCNICQRTKYSQRGSIRYVIQLHVPFRPWSNITMDFLQMSALFTKCSVLYPKIMGGEDHIVCISRPWTISNKQSGFQVLIPVPDNFSAEQCTATLNTHVVPTMGYSYGIVFDCDTLFMSSQFQSWATSKAIKLELFTVYDPQMDRQSEIVNKEIMQVARL